jgi:glucan phosphoethanolaminetransferase (alkaline phosphatase superfamily)
MKFVGVLGLLFGIVFGLMAFGSVMSVSQDTASTTTGGLAELVAQFPVIWMVLLGVVGVAAVIAAAKIIR